jgi:hypothetical protein
VIVPEKTPGRNGGAPRWTRIIHKARTMGNGRTLCVTPKSYELF